jgi:hypothetical protein
MAVAIALVTAIATVPVSALAPPPSPMVTVDVTISPQGVMIYPTEDWDIDLNFAGAVVVNKLRPDSIYITMEHTITTDWVGFVTPQTMEVRQMGNSVHHFNAQVYVPDHMVGPPTVTFTVRAMANLGGRTVEDSVDVTITMVPRNEDFMTSMTAAITLYRPSRDIFGEMRLNNHQDRSIDVGISTLGKWERLLPDLKFTNPVQLAPSESRRVGFQGTLTEELDLGRYELPIELWTTSEGGNRIIMERANITLNVVSQPETDLEIYARLVLLFMVIIVTPMGAVVMFWLWRNRARWVEPWEPHQLRRWLRSGLDARLPARSRGGVVR